MLLLLIVSFDVADCATSAAIVYAVAALAVAAIAFASAVVAAISPPFLCRRCTNKTSAANETAAASNKTTEANEIMTIEN